VRSGGLPATGRRGLSPTSAAISGELSASPPEAEAAGRSDA
jgi:hypothetical protein